MSQPTTVRPPRNDEEVPIWRRWVTSALNGFVRIPGFKSALAEFGGETNYSQFEADGTYKANGDATTWEDVQFVISSGRVAAANFPTWETFTTNTSEYSFAVNDYIDLGANEPFHGWQEGTDISIHLHVTTKAANATGDNRYAKFTVYFGYADVNEAWVETSLTAELTIPTGSPVLHHFLLSMGNLSLPNNKIGTQIKPRLKRIAATGGTEYASNIFVTQLGAHIKQDTIGSREIATK